MLDMGFNMVIETCHSDVRYPSLGLIHAGVIQKGQLGALLSTAAIPALHLYT